MSRASLTAVLCGVMIGGGTAVAAGRDPGGAPSNVPDDPFAWLSLAHVLETDVDASEIDIEGGDVRMFEIDAAFHFPIVDSDDVVLASGLNLGWHSFSFQRLEITDQDLYTVLLPVDLIYRGFRGWLVHGTLSPGLFSDFGGLTTDDFRTLARALVFLDCTDSLRLGVGVAYDRDFGDDRIYPVGGCLWHIGPEWKLDLMLPRVRVTYAPAPEWALGLGLQPAGRQWHLREGTDEAEYDFTLRRWRLTASIEYELAANFRLQGALGAEFNREYKVRHGPARLLDSEVDDTVFVQAGIVMR